MLLKRLKRVFNIDIETCGVRGGAVKVIACIDDPVVIENDSHPPRQESWISGSLAVAALSGPAAGGLVRPKRARATVMTATSSAAT